MDRYTKDIGGIIYLTVEAGSLLLLKMHMKEIGSMENLRAKEAFTMLMGLYIQDSGKMGRNMEMEKRCGLMELNTLASMLQVKKKGLESLHILMGVLMKVTFSKVIFMVKVDIPGQMGENMKGIGKRIRWMARAYLHGVMEVVILESIKMIGKKEEAC